MLAKRLVRGLPTLEDAERAMLGQLRDIYDHTSKLKQMMLDLDTAKDLDRHFGRWLDTQAPIASADHILLLSSFKVLSQAHWPLQPPAQTFLPPVILDATCSKFEDFFRTAHPGKRLFWYWQLCHGELRMNPPGSSGPPYAFRLSAFQMAILLLFNDAPSLSYTEILEATGVTAETLTVFLNLFVKIKLMNVEEREAMNVYSINEKFTSKKKKIDLTGSLKTQRKTELMEARHKIKEDQMLLMQASFCHFLTPVLNLNSILTLE